MGNSSIPLKLARMGLVLSLIRTPRRSPRLITKKLSEPSSRIVGLPLASTFNSMPGVTGLPLAVSATPGWTFRRTVWPSRVRVPATAGAFPSGRMTGLPGSLPKRFSPGFSQ